MPQKPFADALNEQIANEFAAHQQYIGAAVYYESETLPHASTTESTSPIVRVRHE